MSSPFQPSNRAILLNNSADLTEHDPVWSKWNPRQYLADFYSSVDEDEIETIAFLHEITQRVPSRATLLEFGSGPTLHHIFPFVPTISEIHIADLLPSNLSEIQTWLDNKAEGHNWDRFIAYTLSCEGITPSEALIAARAQETRTKVTKLMTADAQHEDPLGQSARNMYPVVMSCYCADSATDNHHDFENYVSHILSLLQPGGLFILACLHNAMHYRVGSTWFPSANVTQQCVHSILGKYCVLETLSISIKNLPSHIDQGYTSILLSYATKR